MRVSFEMDNRKKSVSLIKQEEMGLDGNETSLQGYVKEFETTAKKHCRGATSGVKSGCLELCSTSWRKWRVMLRQNSQKDLT